MGTSLLHSSLKLPCRPCSLSRTSLEVVKIAQITKWLISLTNLLMCCTPFSTHLSTLSISNLNSLTPMASMMFYRILIDVSRLFQPSVSCMVFPDSSMLIFFPNRSTYVVLIFSFSGTKEEASLPSSRVNVSSILSRRDA